MHIPLLSIAIPTFQRAKLLQETLDSFVDQLTDEIEVVVSDNGSTDATAFILEEYKIKCPHLSSYRLPYNQGIDANIVNVIEHCQGEYIFLFSDDDLMLPHMLSTLLTQIKKHKPSMMCLNHFPFKNDPKLGKLPPVLPLKDIYFDSGSAFFSYCGLGFISSLVMQRSLVCKYLSQAKIGRESSHLDIASRIALRENKPFIFLGTLPVAGRCVDKPRYDIIASSIIFVAQTYRDLFQEGSMSLSVYRHLLRRLIWKDLAKIGFKVTRFKQNSFVLHKKDLDELFMHDFIYRFVLRPLFSLDHRMIQSMYAVLIFFFQIYRKTKKLY